ncbi:membrane-associated tyrosine- and threonine-specific cdc2-inhibitory kinase-like [Diabrotica virgifera virgifera]|uniref:non-specific serine/threonine protein kinase n=1 Tax=Diabrotica virgifera virgifera TaxID=50390 RepID=A0ABM5L9A6_DIAVI|nr:membrane-associated tyrosine- and threonine-specific cdc2-inhibitory kinase-like [Diabrotica virgifera virgifera]
MVPRTALLTTSTNRIKLAATYNPTSTTLYIDQIYNDIRELAHGGFGTVYKATLRTTGKKYAIKKFMEDKSALDKWMEVKNNEKVGDHLYCTHYFGAWKQMKDIYMCLQLSQMSLHDFVKDNPFQEMLLWDVLHDVGQALHYLHVDKKYVHHDIKSKNILIHGNFFKLADFGLMEDFSKM